MNKTGKGLKVKTINPKVAHLPGTSGIFGIWCEAVNKFVFIGYSANIQLRCAGLISKINCQPQYDFYREYGYEFRVLETGLHLLSQTVIDSVQLDYIKTKKTMPPDGFNIVNPVTGMKLE